MTREQKIAKARELRAGGLKNAEIGEELGVPTGTVAAWLRGWPYPPRKCLSCEDVFQPKHGNQRCCSHACGHRNDNARKRRSEEKNRGSCIDCGEPLGLGGSWRDRRRCWTCWTVYCAERKDPRSRQIEAWWAEGLTLREIASRLGWTIGHLGQEMIRLRDLGYDLPYRYVTGDRAGRRVPEMAA